MKEIVLRGWDRESDSWFYFNIVPFFFSRELLSERFRNVFADKDIDYKTLSLRTGLQDAKGVEIWEGDILEAKLFYNDSGKTGDFEVKYFDHLGGLGINGDRIPLYDEVRVIGNIYENPDLLSQ